MDLNKPQPNQTLFKYLRQQRENQRIMNSVEISVTLFAIAFFGFTAIKPSVSTIISLKSEIKIKEKAVKDMKTRINNIVSAQNNFALVQDDLPLLNSSLPSRANFGDIADQIEGTSVKANTSLQAIGLNLNKENSAATNQYQYYPVSISGEDQFSDTIDFIDRLTKNRRTMEILNVTLAKRQDTVKDSKAPANAIVFTIATKFISLPKNDKK